MVARTVECGAGDERMKRKYKVVCVKWDDAAWEKGPIVEGEYDDHFYVYTIGAEVRNDAKFVTVVQDVIDGDHIPRFRDATHIPKKMIVRRRVLGTVEIEF